MHLLSKGVSFRIEGFCKIQAEVDSVCCVVANGSLGQQAKGPMGNGQQVMSSQALHVLGVTTTTSFIKVGLTEPLALCQSDSVSKECKKVFFFLKWPEMNRL